MGKAPAKNHNFNDVLLVFFNIIYKVLSFSVIFQHTGLVKIHGPSRSRLVFFVTTV